MLFNIIATLVVASALYNSYKDFRKDSSVLKIAYLKNKIDYLWAFLIVTFVFTTVISLSFVEMPKFLTWSWLSLLDSSKSSGSNIVSAPFNSGSIFIISGFWLLISLALPYLAKAEEEAFRSEIFTTRKRITRNISFGLAHMVMGVPLFVALILSIVGYIFSIFYIRGYKRASQNEDADELGIIASTSVHAKYNFLIMSIGAILSILVLMYS